MSRPTKFIMSSGRTYEIPDFHDKKYKNGWVYFYDNSGSTIIGLRKDQIEAEIWDHDKVKESHVNTNEL